MRSPSWEWPCEDAINGPRGLLDLTTSIEPASWEEAFP